MGIFWCISITNNVNSCKKFNEKAQMTNFGVLAKGRRPCQELFAKKHGKLGKLKRKFVTKYPRGNIYGQLGGAKLSRCCWQHFSCHLVTLSPPSIDSSVTSFHPRLNNLYSGAPDNHCAAAEGRMQQVGHICLTLQRGA